MLVETFEINEVANEPAEVSEECAALVEQLGLDGQKEFCQKSEEGVNSRTPYRKMTDDERYVYKMLCPEECKIENYEGGAIPLRVLQVAAHAKSCDGLGSLYVWDRSRVDIKDPVLIAKIPGKEYSDDCFILARWGEELEPLHVLRERAHEVAAQTAKAFLGGIVGKAQSMISMIDSGNAVGINSKTLMNIAERKSYASLNDADLAAAEQKLAAIVEAARVVSDLSCQADTKMVPGLNSALAALDRAAGQPLAQQDQPAGGSLVESTEIISKPGDAIECTQINLTAEAQAQMTVPDGAFNDLGQPAGEGEPWLTIETAPKDGTEILGYRSDAGVMLIRYLAPVDFLADSELDGLDERSAEQEDWFYADFVVGGRLEGDERPTHWRPQTGVADSGSKDYQTPQSEIVTHMRGTLERVMMYLTNVNSCDPVELGVRVAQSLRLGGADKHMLDEAVEALTKGFAPAAMEPDIDLANDYRQLKENAEELAAMVETLADQGQQLQFTVDKLAGLLFRQHETQLRLDIRHHMLAWAEDNYDIEVDDFEIATRVKQERWRTVPCNNSVGFDTRFVRGASGPGSYPVTVLDLREWS
eukprot:g14974.t1